MKLLLDTCAVIFLADDDPRITSRTREILASSDGIFLSAVTAGELACLQQRGRIELSDHWKPWFRDAVNRNEWNVLPMDPGIMEEVYSLPESFHADPADRVITATARIHRLTVLTTDRKILDYPHVDATW